MKSLVVFYSMTGNSRKVASILGSELDANIEEIKTEKKTFIPLMLVCSFLGRLPKIKPPERDASKYDLLVLGTPVMATRPSPPIMAYIRQNRNRFPGRVALFMCCGGFREKKAMSRMVNLTGKDPVAMLILKENEIRTGTFEQKVKDFTKKLLG